MSPELAVVASSPIGDRAAAGTPISVCIDSDPRAGHPRVTKPGMPGMPRLLLVAGLLLGAPLTVVSAQAGERSVIVTTRIVMASNHGSAQLRGADLVSLGRSLRQFPYKSFRLIQSESRPVLMEKMAEFPIPGGRHLLVQPTGYENGRVSLYVMLMHGQRTLVNTVLKLRNRGEFIVAGPRHEDGVLFLSIGARVDGRGASTHAVGRSR